MEYTEIHGNLFDAPKEFQLAQCISADAKMGAGIAVEFRKRFKLGILQEVAKDGDLKVGSCHWVDRSLNLITKERYWHKPTYQSLRKSLESMRSLCIEERIDKVAMPKIGSGLDRLQWSQVREILKEVFDDTDIEIVVYRI